MTYYLDTSVVMSLFLTDSNSPAVHHWVNGDPERFAVSGWVACEFLDNIGRLQRAGVLSAKEAVNLRAAVDHWLTEVCERLPFDDAMFDVMAEHLRDHTLALRSKDAIHLTVAIRNAAILVTSDRALASACQRLGHPSLLLVGTPH
jgi:predicted nucleic acid-binding protein